MNDAPMEPSPALTLSERLAAFELDDPAADLPFSARLARENSWSRGYARRVMREYLRFVQLAIEAGHPVTPSEEVDQAWHLHMIYTRSYWDDLCGSVLGRPLHHGPTKGGPAEGAKFHDWYAATLDSYRRIFREEPPADIWPAVKARFAGAGRQRFVDPRTHWIIRKPDAAVWRRRAAVTARAAAALGLCAAAAFGLTACVRGLAAAPGIEAGMLKLGGIAGIVVLICYLRTRAVQSLRQGRGQPPLTDGELDACELAWLRGGGKRALLAAAAGLLHRGCVHVNKTGIFFKKRRLQATGVVSLDLMPLEDSLLRAIAASYSGLTWPEIRQTMAGTLLLMQDRMVQRGILVNVERRSQHGSSLLLAGVLGAFLIGALAWSIAGQNVGLATGFAVLIAGLIAVIPCWRTLPRITDTGMAASQESSPQWRHVLSGGAGTTQLVVLAVASSGDAALTGSLFPLRELRDRPDTSSSSSGGCGSGCSSSGCGTSSSDSSSSGHSGCGASGCGSSGGGSSGCGSSGCGSSGCGGGGCGGS